MKRREFSKATAGLVAGATIGRTSAAEKELMVDVHQHVNFHGRRNPDFVAHQKRWECPKQCCFPPVPS